MKPTAKPEKVCPLECSSRSPLLEVPPQRQGPVVGAPGSRRLECRGFGLQHLWFCFRPISILRKLQPVTSKEHRVDRPDTGTQHRDRQSHRGREQSVFRTICPPEENCDFKRCEEGSNNGGPESREKQNSSQDGGRQEHCQGGVRCPNLRHGLVNDEAAIGQAQQKKTSAGPAVREHGEESLQRAPWSFGRYHSYGL